jgi:acyl-CoA thioesterase II
MERDEGPPASDDQHGAVDITAVLAVLDIEALDRDLFRGPPISAADPRANLFGGQVAAQALRAAYCTVPEARFVHSLHGYFLRAGASARPVIYSVQRSRDGGSFSQRNVLAIQEGEVIFTASCSFHRSEQGANLETRSLGSDVPAPESLKRQPEASYFLSVMDVRYLNPDMEPGRNPSLWLRPVGAVPDGRILNECLLTYVSDYGSGFRGSGVEGLADMGTSLDHIIWFHRPHRMQEWMYMDLWPVWASGGRGLYHGALFDRGGLHIATIAQEALMRRTPPTPRLRP